MDNLVYKNEKLSKYSWFGLGGLAKIFFKPKSALDLEKFLEKYNKKNKKIYILGAGSNTLFRDSEVCSPVAGLKTLDVFFEDPLVIFPSIKCSIKFISAQNDLIKLLACCKHFFD